MKYTKILTFLFICSIFFKIEAGELILPQTPVSMYEDTESSVSAQLPALDENDREFSFFNPQWNMVRVTSCGVDCLSENVKIVSTADGLLIRVR